MSGSVRTGDTSPVMQWVAAAVLAVSGMYVTGRKRGGRI